MTDRQLAVREAAQIVQPKGFDDDTKDLIRKTVSDPRNPLTTDEFDLFIAVCQHIGANPLLREAYALKDRTGRFSVAVGIDKFRQMSQSNPRYVGQAGPEWCGKDGVWRDVWLEDHPPAAARVGIWMRGAREPTWGVATYKASHRNSPQWNDNPAHMLAVRAEAHAHRKCSSRLSGQIVLQEEPADRPDYVDADGVIDEPRQQALGAGRSQAIADALDAEIAAIDAETLIDQAVATAEADAGITEHEREQEPASGTPSWAGTPLGRQISALVDALDAAGKKFSLPADDATEADLKGFIASKRTVLGGR